MGWRDIFRRRGGDSSQVRPDQRHIVAASPDLDATCFFLAAGGSVSVSDEDQYQESLGPLLPPGLREKRVDVELRMCADGNPWRRTVRTPVLEVALPSGQTVGFLTPKMTDRYQPLLDEAERQGRRLRSAALLSHSTKNGRSYVVIELSAVPRFAHRNNIGGLDVETRAEHVVYRPTGTFHGIEERAEDGSVRTHCGKRFSAKDFELVFRTTPWVGRVYSDGMLVDEQAYRRCSVCGGPGSGSVGGSSRSGGTEERVTPKKPDVSTGTDIRTLLADRLDFDVAGESFRDGYPDNLLRLREAAEASGGAEPLACVLVRDPANEYDPNAIEIHVPGEAGHVGYVPADLAARIAPLLDADVKLQSWAIAVRVHPDAPDHPGLTVGIQLAGG